MCVHGCAMPPPIFGAVSAVDLDHSHRGVAECLCPLSLQHFPGTHAAEHLNIFLCHPWIFDKLSMKVFGQVLTNLSVSSLGFQNSQ